MIHPAISYKNNKKDVRFNQYASTKFLDKYIKLGNEPNPFLLDENKLINGDISKIVPGKIYTYMYDPKYKDVLSFYDTRPIIFAEKIELNKNTNNVILSGINFNFIPPIYKVAMLSKFYELFKVEIEKDESNLWEDKFIIIGRIIAFLKHWLSKKLLINSNPNLNFGFANRNYIITRIKNLRVIDYDDWELIPFLISREIIGKTLPEIYTEYYQSLKK